LVDLASEHVPHEPLHRNHHDESASNSKKRKGSQDNKNGDDNNKKAKLFSPHGKADNNNNGDLTIGEREDNAMESLKVFVEQKGGTTNVVVVLCLLWSILFSL
jgi:hypothetical protein